MPGKSSDALRTKAGWLRLIETCLQVKDRTRLRLDKEFIVRYGAGREEVIPAGTEVVFYCLYKGSKATTQKFRTEGVFYLPDGRTLSILGYYGRKAPKGLEKEYRRKTVEVKDPNEGSGIFDSLDVPRLAATAVF